jgi:plasmid stabilization system protein ParE
MNYTLHPGAQQDVEEALDFYLEHAGIKVATRFLAEFERVAGLLAQNPGFGTPTHRGRRSYPLSVFPYSIVYRVLEDHLRILVVRHQHRRPNFASSRQ